MKRWGIWALVVGSVVLATLPLIPPSPDAGEFSATRAMAHISEIGRSPHPIGSTENQRVRTYLIGRLAALGLSPHTQAAQATDYFGAPGSSIDVVNVIVRIEGTGDGDALALVAHYDTVPTTPGANDNSASVAILLEVAAALTADGSLENDVILLFTDGEEPAPRIGSRAFVDEHPWFDDVAFVMNLESSGSSGGSILGESSGPTGWLIDKLAESTRYPLAYSFFTEIAASVGGFGTDFDPFREAGVPGLAFAYLHGSPVYHTDRDSTETVSLRSVQHQGANTLALVRFLVDSDLTPPSDATDSVFFSVGRWTVVRYPTSLSVPLALAALAVFGIAIFRGFRPKSPAKGVGVALGALVVAAVAGALLWTLITTIRTDPSIWESYTYLVALLLATGGLWRLLAARRDSDTLLFGVVGVWLLLSLATSLLAPGTSYLFTWPALAGSFYVLARPHAPFWSMLVVTVVPLVATLPTIDFIFQLAQPRPGNPDSELIPVAGVATAMAILLIAMINPAVRAQQGESGP